MGLLPSMSIPALKFTEPGTAYTGTLTEIGEEQQARKYTPDGPGDLDYWDDAKTQPRMQRRFLLQVAPDPTIAGDDGVRAVYATVSGKPGGMYHAINTALSKANALGGQLTLTFTGTDPASKNPANPRKLYAASYAEPSLAAQMTATSAAPAVPPPAPAVPSPAAPAPAPAAPAPAAETIPPGFDADTWARVTPAAKAAILAQQ